MYHFERGDAKTDGWCCEPFIPRYILRFVLLSLCWMDPKIIDEIHGYIINNKFLSSDDETFVVIHIPFP